ncbi:uncharacterized protein LTHEOB_5170 [Lasiodiplodia theobromae]|uniref:Uncharacterized protein n=1 Tax=Lasiodiplodia theobromae TaxID=45133 RepID=A0A5N5D5G6_9PEZI|nr:uncharacterized protein LTHEOB_5170 [Lasiodiplodia theobromae]KAB2572979.1 hypothetical protein DBV05_g8367 [Lasiodiplodia theobromae]KAF4545337.1 hypothetical protein LTHEOB_5170 [Lasiodiplodia theobromae]
MPSKPSFWSKSNKSQASVGSATDYASSASSEHRFRQPDDAQLRTYPSPLPPSLQSSNLSLDPPPAGAVVGADAPATPVNRASAQPYAYTPQPDRSVNTVPEKKSLRSRLGLGHSSKESTDLQSKDKGLGRRVSVRKKDVPGQRPQSVAEDHRYWQQAKQLAPSHEVDEHNAHLDPFLVQPEPRSPVPPAKDPYYEPKPPPTIGQNPDPNEYRRASLARVNTQQSFQQSLRGRNSGEYQHGPHPHGNGGLNAHNPPPPHYQQSYPQQPQVQANQNQHYQALNPHSADGVHPPSQQHPHEFDSEQAAQEYIKKQADFQAYQRLQEQEQQKHQQQQQQGRPGSRQQQEQDLQFIPPETPQQQKFTPIVRVPVQPQPQPQPQRLSHEQPTPHPPQAPPSPSPSHQSQNLAPHSAQDFVVTPVKEIHSQPSTEQMPPASNKRSSEVPKGGMGGPPSRENSNLAQQANRQTFSADVVPSGAQDQRFRGGKNGSNDNESGRGTPPPKRAVSDMSDEDVAQLMKEHDVLREKYQKVKRYFFEQQSQVHSLQNTLAHQRLSQSRTSLDDTEYHARFERLHGLVKQAAFAIRKIWKEIPPWLQTAVNHDAVKVGTREMTAVGRAVLSKWLIDEVFNKFFHPDLDQHLSKQLKSCHNNIRKNAPIATNPEEEEALTSKLVNWRLATIEGFAEQLRGPQATANRELLIKSLNESLTATMEMYVVDPNHEDFLELKANVSPIIELTINIISHLPLESREIVVEHYPPGHGIMGEQMTVESGIPPLAQPCADGVLQHRDSESAERASLASATSDLKDVASVGPAGGEDDSQQSSPQGQQQGGPQQQQQPDGKRSGSRSMFSSIMGGGGKKLQQSEARQREREQQLGATRTGDNGGSQVSLQSAPPKEELPPRVRIATGLSVRIYGKGVLWKATVFPTA